MLFTTGLHTPTNSITTTTVPALQASTLHSSPLLVPLPRLHSLPRHPGQLSWHFWFEYTPLILSLMREGFSLSTIKEPTRSLVSSTAALLYEIQLLSACNVRCCCPLHCLAQARYQGHLGATSPEPWRIFFADVGIKGGRTLIVLAAKVAETRTRTMGVRAWRRKRDG